MRPKSINLVFVHTHGIFRLALLSSQRIAAGEKEEGQAVVTSLAKAKHHHRAIFICLSVLPPIFSRKKEAYLGLISNWNGSCWQRRILAVIDSCLQRLASSLKPRCFIIFPYAKRIMT